MQQAKLWAMVLTAGLMLVFVWACAGSENAPRLERQTLKSWLADPQVIIIDVRSPQDWEGSSKKIKGAQRRDYKEIKTWAASLPKDKKIVFYCA